jgi:hypothetical protein
MKFIIPFILAFALLNVVIAKEEKPSLKDAELA